MGVVWVAVRKTDKMTATGVMKDIVEITTLTMNVTNHLINKEIERETSYHSFPRPMIPEHPNIRKHYS